MIVLFQNGITIKDGEKFVPNYDRIVELLKVNVKKFKGGKNREANKKWFG